MKKDSRLAACFLMLISLASFAFSFYSSSSFGETAVPILMTALAAGLALVPLALSAGEPGSEIQAPMAMVILCGLASSTLLNMIVVPALYLRFGSLTAQREAAARGTLAAKTR